MKLKPIFIALILSIAITSGAMAQNTKPNILVIWGDDIGQSNLSAYTRGMMGYRTPNIDRIANEGMIFTDYYGEQSCTAGRASFMLGQSVYRSGLSKVGMPGAEKGINVLDPTIAVLLKDQGYATGQFGKNHFGDLDEMLPTNHGFDEFLGNPLSSQCRGGTGKPRTTPKTQNSKRDSVHVGSSSHLSTARSKTPDR